MADAWESVLEWLMVRPGRARDLAQTFGWVAFVLTVMAMAARVVTTVGGIVTSMAKIEGEDTLASMYPSLPTWFVPESWASYVLIAGLWGVSLWLGLLAKRLHRAYLL